jgi:hypothetical protein
MRIIVGLWHVRNRMTREDLFWSRTIKGGPDECWTWTGMHTGANYGMIRTDGGTFAMAHRFAYEMLVGQIPEGLNLDHTCHNLDLTCRLGDSCPHRRCVNPAHLEPVPQAVNVRRGRLGGKVSCPQGHPYDNANTAFTKSGARSCRTCHRQREAARKASNPPLKVGSFNGQKIHCKQGHPYEGDNLFVNSEGRRRCRACANARVRESALRRRQRKVEAADAERDSLSA